MVFNVQPNACIMVYFSFVLFFTFFKFTYLKTGVYIFSSISKLILISVYLVFLKQVIFLPIITLICSNTSHFSFNILYLLPINIFLFVGVLRVKCIVMFLIRTHLISRNGKDMWNGICTVVCIEFYLNLIWNLPHFRKSYFSFLFSSNSPPKMFFVDFGCINKVNSWIRKINKILSIDICFYVCFVYSVIYLQCLHTSLNAAPLANEHRVDFSVTSSYHVYSVQLHLTLCFPRTIVLLGQQVTGLALATPTIPVTEPHQPW